MANPKEELKSLLAQRTKNLDEWVIGKIPRHFKRISVSEEEMLDLARLGAMKMAAYYDIKTFFCQSLIAGAIFSEKYDKFTIVTPWRYGKAISNDTEVLTRNGWKKHGDLIVGDEVISPNGDFVKVTHVHPKCEMDRVVVLESGDEFTCHHNHEWRVLDRNSHKVKDIETSEIERRGTMNNDGHRKFEIPVKDAVKGEQKELAVSPYVLGVWLGDGTTTQGQICASPSDREVLDRCREYYPDGAEWVHKGTGVITASFKGLASDLSTFGLCRQKEFVEKFIPDEYYTASIEQRLELLAGLIDTDGYTNNDKTARTVFTTASEKLRDSVEKLISTFGWRVSVTEIPPKMSSSGIQGKKPYWVIGFTPTIDIPCVLERKRPTKFGKQKRIGIKEVRHTSGIEGNCITVEGGVYCIGKHLVPTHNSFLLGHVAPARAYEGHQVYITGGDTDTASIIMQATAQAVQDIAPEVKNALMNKQSEIERLATSLSKTRLAFANGGFVESITLGDSFKGIKGNKAVGRSGDFYIDEAALVSSNALRETMRREFDSLDGTRMQSVMISNPHQPGKFYDDLTIDEPRDNHFILWIDVLTGIEEERWSEEFVLESEAMDDRESIVKYLLCNLPESGESMFDEPKVYEGTYDDTYCTWYLGVDSAYKGKDNITCSLISVNEDGIVHADEIFTIDKVNWIDGVTSDEVIKHIAMVAKKMGVALTCVDIGQGIWLYEGLRKTGINVQSVNFGSSPTSRRASAGHYASRFAQNMRAELHLDLQSLIEKERIYLSREVYDSIKGILPFVTTKLLTNGKKQVRPKSEIKALMNGKSPDELDSLLLAIHAAIVFSGEYISD